MGWFDCLCTLIIPFLTKQLNKNCIILYKVFQYDIMDKIVEDFLREYYDEIIQCIDNDDIDKICQYITDFCQGYNYEAYSYLIYLWFMQYVPPENFLRYITKIPDDFMQFAGEECPYTDLIIPNNIKSIGNWAFWDCGLQNLIIPNSVKIIYSNAFHSCPDLETVKIKIGCEEIEDFAFGGCEKLSAVELPISIKRIGTGAFASCWLLKTIFYKGRMTDWDKIAKSIAAIHIDTVIKCIDGDITI